MLNVRSVLTRSKVINKPIALNELVSQQDYNILVMIETWLRCKGDEAYIVEITPPNYTIIHTPRPMNSKTSRGGGVGMMYRNDMYKAKTGYGQKPGWSKSIWSKARLVKSPMVKSPIKQTNKHLNFKINLFDIYVHIFVTR